MELLNVGLDNTHNLFWPDLHKHFFWQKSILLVVQLGKRAVENVTNKYSKAVRPFATTGVFLGLLDYLGYLWK